MTRTDRTPRTKTPAPRRRVIAIGKRGGGPWPGRTRHPRDRAERLAGEDDQPPVPLRPHRGEIALRHDGPCAVERRQLEDGVQVAVAAMEVKHAGASASVERLHDHLAAEDVEEGLQA